MNDNFSVDLAKAKDRCLEARRSLLELLSRLSDADLAISRRGGWTVRQTLEHVLESDNYYIDGISRLRQLNSQGRPKLLGFDSITDVAVRLEVFAAHLEQALAGIDEESFYKLERLGHQDYS